MRKFTTIHLHLAAAILFGSACAQANTIRFTQATADPIAVNDKVNIDVSMQFDDRTVGGRFQLDFDSSILQLIPGETQWGQAASGAAFLQCPPAQGACGAADFQFGNVPALGGAGLSETVATLVFLAVGIGTSPVTGGAIIDNFVNDNFPVETLTVGFEGASVTVVPVPAAAYLLFSGLMLLACRRRCTPNSTARS